MPCLVRLSLVFHFCDILLDLDLLNMSLQNTKIVNLLVIIYNGHESIYEICSISNITYCVRIPTDTGWVGRIVCRARCGLCYLWLPLLP